MDNAAQLANPYSTPRNDEQPTIAARTDKQLGWSVVLAGLVIVGAVFGPSLVATLTMFDALVQFFFGSSPVGSPRGTQIMQACTIFGFFGLLGGSLAIPLLVFFNRKAKLGFWTAFGSIAVVGTIAFVMIAAFSDSSRGIGSLSPVLTDWLCMGCVIWLPSLIAAMAYGLWIHFMRQRA